MLFKPRIRGDSPQLDDKNIMENIGTSFVKCVRQVTNIHCGIIFSWGKGRGLSQFQDTSAKVVNWGTGPVDGYVTFREDLWLEGRNSDVSPHHYVSHGKVFPTISMERGVQCLFFFIVN